MNEKELNKYLKQNITKIKNAKSQNEITEIIKEQNQTIEKWVKTQFK